jgi:restriction system protein
VEIALAGILIPDKILVPDKPTKEGILVRATTAFFDYILNYVDGNWSRILEFDDRQFEEIIAGYFHTLGYKTTLTPRTGDLGRDVIAETNGLGCVRILGSAKRYTFGHLVPASDVRDLMGALSIDPNASKAMLITTSDFAPRLSDDPGLMAAQPFRLELVNGRELQERLKELRNSAPSLRAASLKR